MPSRRRKLPPRMFTRERKSGKTYCCWWIDSSGIRRQKALGADLDRAIRLQREIERGAEVGDPFAQSQRPVESLIAPYLQDLRTRAKPFRVEQVERCLHEILDLDHFGPISNVTVARVMAVRAHFVEKGLANSTVNDKIGALKSMFRWAAGAGLLAHDPIAGMRQLPMGGRHATRKRRKLTVEEVEKLRAAIRVGVRGLGYWRLVETILVTGFRLGEATQLAWGDLIEDRGRWWLRVRSETAKTNKSRVNPITDDLAEMLRGLREDQARKLRREIGDGDRIFLSPEGKAFVRRNAFRWLMSVRKRAGFPEVFPDGSRFNFYALRHTFATHLVQAGVPLEQTKELMGHATVRLTANIYADMGRLDTTSAIERLTNLRSLKQSGPG